MALTNRHDGWGAVSRLFHWGMALLILGNFLLGWAADEWERSPLKIDLFVLHKSIGLTVLLLVCARLGWLLLAGRPSPLSMSDWQRRAAGAVHITLYVLMFTIPLSGWLLNAWADFPLKWFWLYPVPDLVAPSEMLKELGEEVHETLVGALLFVLVVHVGAAVKHHVIDGDATLTRMWRGRAR